MNFVEPVIEFTASDVVVTGGTILSFDPDFDATGYHYRIMVIPTGCTVTIKVPANVLRDAGGNLNLASNTSSTTVNLGPPPSTLPTAVLATRYVGPTTVGSFMVEVAISRPVTFITKDRFQITNGRALSLSLSQWLGNDTQIYQLAVEPLAPGPVTVQLPAGGAQTAYGSNQVSNTVSVNYTPDLNAPGLLYEFYKGLNFDDLYYTIASPTVEWRFGLNGLPAEGNVLAVTDNFSLKAYGKVIPQFTETYRFSMNSDDGVRLYIDGVKILDTWDQVGVRWLIQGQDVTLTAGREHDIKIEYREQTGDAQLFLFWQSPSQALQPVPGNRLKHSAPPRTGVDTTPPTLVISGPATAIASPNPQIWWRLAQQRSSGVTGLLTSTSTGSGYPKGFQYQAFSEYLRSHKSLTVP